MERGANFLKLRIRLFLLRNEVPKVRLYISRDSLYRIRSVLNYATKKLYAVSGKVRHISFADSLDAIPRNASGSFNRIYDVHSVRIKTNGRTLAVRPHDDVVFAEYDEICA